MDHRVDDYLALCQAVGHIVVEWSLVERQFDNWISVAFKQCEGYKLRKNADLPISFKQKKEFLNDCFRKLPILAPFKDEGLDLVQQAVAFSNKRHDIVHGSIMNMTPPNRIFRFQILRSEKTHHRIEEFNFNAADFPNLEKTLGDLLTDSMNFSVKLGEAFLK